MGIAVCSMYSTGAMVLLDGLEAGSHSVMDRLEVGPYLSYRGNFPDLIPTPLPGNPLEGTVGPGWLRPASLTFGNSTVSVRLLSSDHPGFVEILSLPLPSPKEVRISRSLMQELGLTAGSSAVVDSDLGSESLDIVELPRAAIGLPERWVMLDDGDLRQIASVDPEEYDFLLVTARQDALDLASEGYTVQSLSSGADFFLDGLDQARKIVLGIVVASSIAVAALTFSLLSLEVRYRHKEMEGLRALGMDDRGLLWMYGLQMTFILIAGSVLGLSMGIVVANGLVSFSPFFGLSTVITPQITATGLLIPLISSLVAGAAGGATTIALTLRRFSYEA